MAWQLIQGGLADCVLALGFEKMEKGPVAVNVSLNYFYFRTVKTL